MSAPDRAARLPTVGSVPSAPERQQGLPHPSDMMATTARNLSTRYLVVLVQIVTGLFMVRFNMQHLGQDIYGLWMLVASLAAYFTALDFGYGSAVVRFVAEYRRRNDVQAINEVVSTMAFVFTGVGLFCYAAAIVASLLLPDIFNLPPGQERTGQIVMLVVSVQVALFFPFSVYGGIINGFERYHLNNMVGLFTQLATAAVNVLVLALGYGLVELVVATTAMRTLPLWVYRRNAYRVFPALQIRRSNIHRARLRQLSGFSAYAAVVEWSGRLMFASGAFFLGIFVTTAAVFVYSVAQRIADAMLTLTEQLHTLMMPAIVTRALDDTTERQRTLMVRATRLQLAIAMGLAGGVAAVAGAVIRAWLGPGVEASVLVTQLLALVVVLRAAAAMPLTVLQGTGHPRYAAKSASAGAIVNLAASVPLVQAFGPAGVALAAVLGTSVNLATVFPRTCHVVGLSVWHGVRTIVLPTVWPAVVAGAIIASTQSLLPGGLVPALANVALGGLLYVTIFLFFGLERDERQWLAATWRRLTRDPAAGLATTDLPNGRMVHYLKESALTALEDLGASRRIGRTTWRRRRLLILCYHGVSLTNEHEWAPGLYVSPAHFEERLTTMHNEGCAVLPLGWAIEALYAGELPERAVALTFDDGYYDFAARAWPILRQFGYPATVYLTTERVDHNLPNVNLFISYALWLAGGRDFDARGFRGMTGRYPLQTPTERDAAFLAIIRALRTNRTDSDDHVARLVVERLGLDYEALLADRVLTLMRPEEVSQLAAEGLDVQMHTHLHRSPPDPDEFVRDVLVNRDRIKAMTGTCPHHFCYPSGYYRPEYVPALRHAGIKTATTCDPGMATAHHDPLLLPRFIDTSGVPPIAFRSWLTGAAEYLPRRTRRGGDPVDKLLPTHVPARSGIL